MEGSTFHCDLIVRDYECDIQGIVNNANYQHYLEHARHLFLKENGLDFAQLTAEGIILIVIRIEIDYKSPLKPGDEFRVYLKLERVSRIRFKFVQEIRRKSDNKICIQAEVFTAAMNDKGRPINPEVIQHLLD